MPRLAILILALAAVLSAQKFYPDDPLAEDPKPRDASQAIRRKLSDIYDLFKSTLSTPGEKALVPGQPPVRARAVDTTGEPPNGAWYTRRHYYRRMTVEELVRGGGGTRPPASGKWTVTGAKNEGITPGLVVRDSANTTYFVKFDPRSNPEMATAADQIGSKFFYALGYDVPDNYIVYFQREQLQLGGNVEFTDQRGRKRPMTEGDVNDLLLKVPRDQQKGYRATASLALAGKDLGPFRYYGTRSDDPNDVVPHEHRRDIRGLGVFSAWLNHDDSRAINTIDMLQEKGGVKYIHHHLIDFGSALGSGTQKATSARSGGEYLFGWKTSAKQFFTFGFAVPEWAKADFPNLRSVGKFEYERFNPVTWVPEYPNPAFLNRLPDDNFWAAKQVLAFTDDEIRAIVATGQYTDPMAAEWVTKCLIERRNKIGRAFLTRVMPLDKFEVRNGELAYVDLARQHNFPEPNPVRIAWSVFDNRAGTRTPIPGAAGPRVPPSTAEYLAATLSYSDADKRTIAVYLRGGKVVGVERSW